MISIIVPTWNRGPLLVRALESCLAQDYSDYEIIVCDNASTDDTSDLVSSFCARNRGVKVKYIRHDQNIGPGMNWFSGLDVASGDYIKLLFSDDLIAPRGLSVLLDRLCNCEASAVFGRARYLWKNSFKTGNKVLEPGQFSFNDYIGHFFAPAATANEYPVSPCAGLFKKRVFVEVRKDLETLRDCYGCNIVDTGIGIDVYLYLWAWNSAGVAFVDDVVAHFDGHPGSITVSSKIEWLDMHNFAAMNRFFELYPEQRHLIDQWISLLHSSGGGGRGDGLIKLAALRRDLLCRWKITKPGSSPPLIVRSKKKALSQIWEKISIRSFNRFR